MDRLHVTTPDASDIEYIAAHLRSSDSDELRAVHGDNVDILDVLTRAVAVSAEAMVATTPFGEPIALFGVAAASLMGGVASPWLLGTDRLEQHGRELVAFAKRDVARWSLSYDRLVNFVDARNTRSIQWLKRIGFQVFDAKPYGLQGLPFHEFELCT